MPKNIPLTDDHAAAPLFSWDEPRASGVLLHPTSLPSDLGIGNFGRDAIRFLDFLKVAGFRYWQVCPLGPTGYGDSPYQAFSAFAGNPYLIDLHPFVSCGLLEPDEIRPLQLLPGDHVDYGELYRRFWPVADSAWNRFKTAPFDIDGLGSYADFLEREKNWLTAYGLFQGLKEHYQGKPWLEWPQETRDYSRARKAELPGAVEDAAGKHRFLQYVFAGQWQRVRAAAAERGIRIIGDLPIFVALDSADVWENPGLFLLKKNGQPRELAGVPPDYFSSEGQLWGNPVYDWDAHSAENYAWWMRRLGANFDLFDFVRLDHFRGFESYWAIPNSAKPSAKNGKWKKGPGLHFFKALKQKFPNPRVIAEDLGELTDAVIELREATGLPGMGIFHFAFGGDPGNSYLPHNLLHNCALYPGSHDNNTTWGWYHEVDEGTRDHVRRYLRVSGDSINWDLIRCGYESVANLFVIPLQDILNLGAEARLNRPGKAEGNWQWRFQPWQLDKAWRESAGYLQELALLYGRAAWKSESAGS